MGGKEPRFWLIWGQDRGGGDLLGLRKLVTTIGGVKERHEEEKGKLSRQGGGHKQEFKCT